MGMNRLYSCFLYISDLLGMIFLLLSIDTSRLPMVRLICSVAYKQPWMHFARTIDEYILYVIKSGELYIKEGETSYNLKKGDLLLLQPNIPHQGFEPARCEYYYVHFKYDGIKPLEGLGIDDIVSEVLGNRRKSITNNVFSSERVLESSCIIPNHYSLKNTNEFLNFLKETKDNFFIKYENYSELASCRLLELFIKASREFVSFELEKKHSETPKILMKVQSVVNFLNSEYHTKISSEDIERLFETNFDYLNRMFHKTTGYSIFNYLNTTRINKAKELIETTPLKFSEIGYLVGIEDPYYFSKLFKKHTGFAPTDYLKEKNTQKTF